jgi:hypothetical protein
MWRDRVHKLARVLFLVLAPAVAQVPPHSASLPVGPLSDEDLTKLANPHLKPFAMEVKDARWQSPIIFVCWESSAAPYSTEKLWVQTAVKGSWEAASALEFRGWCPCSEKYTGVRIAVDDTPPITQMLGKNLNKQKNGVTLNFTFSKWKAPCSDQREACIRAIAVHEFGHVIGLVHEEYQPKVPDKCGSLVNGPPGDHSLTPFDIESVMSYCNPHYGNLGKLSACDVEAVQAMYGSNPNWAQGVACLHMKT